MALMLRRPITSGSRQAPDPYDQFLESRCMYRKHTARDASCLFRVIAEQMYDTQMLHYEVRLECVRFMTRKRRIFEQHVRGDFDSYMLEMAKPKTYGTMLELRALCCMYRRNVILYEPFNLGTAVTYNDRYVDNFRVFYTNEFHFDSVYKLDYIETAAISQTISFKLLYKMLFKLPDVNFAVESMLHPQTFEWGSYEVEIDHRGYFVRIICNDGRLFTLDLPEHTKCILENYKLCNFHNNPKHLRRNALECSSRRELQMNMDLPISSVMANQSSEILHMCPNPMNSCVRQLLDDGITPFPYKVAKSLDPYMYRNIEFDSWNDLRKEAKRFNVYANDYNFKVGAKCRVEIITDTERQLYTCHIQKISADKSCSVVYIEHFGKKFLVPYESLHPVPPDEFRPWAVPYRYQRQMQRMQLAKLAQKTKPRWKKTKLYDVTNYYETSSVQYMQLDSWHGCPPMLNEPEALQQQQQPQQLPQQLQQQSQQQVEINETTELEQPQHSREQRFPPRENTSRPPKPHQKPQAATAAPVMGATAVPPPMAPQQVNVPTAQIVNYVPISGRAAPLPQPWRGAAQPMAEEFPTTIFPGAPMTPDACMFMHFGGYAPPPISLQASPPSFGGAPLLFAPAPPPLVSPVTSVMVPSVGATVTSSSSSSTNSANMANTTATTSSQYAMRTSSGEDHLEPRRSLHANGEDLPADLSTLRYFYNMGVDVHMRWSNMMPPDEQRQMLSNTNANQNHNNTDQQGHDHNDEAVALVSNTTPPPSPVAAAAVNPSRAYGSGTETSVEKGRGRNKRGGFNRMRGKRPEQLPDVAKDANLSHTMLLPTPTPSPNTNGNQFNFYPTVMPPVPPLPTLPPPQMPSPIFFAPQKVGQPPYAWNMGPPPFVMPFERPKNGAIEQQPTPPGVYKPPRH